MGCALCTVCVKLSSTKAKLRPRWLLCWRAGLGASVAPPPGRSSAAARPAAWPAGGRFECMGRGASGARRPCGQAPLNSAVCPPGGAGLFAGPTVPSLGHQQPILGTLAACVSFKLLPQPLSIAGPGLYLLQARHPVWRACSGSCQPPCHMDAAAFTAGRAGARLRGRWRLARLLCAAACLPLCALLGELVCDGARNGGGGAREAPPSPGGAAGCPAPAILRPTQVVKKCQATGPLGRLCMWGCRRLHTAPAELCRQRSPVQMHRLHRLSQGF
jgi:hypothetical protein